MRVTELREEVADPVPPPARQVGVLRTLAGDRRVRYVVVGGLAAVIYYATFSVGWLLLSRTIPYLLMAVIANIVTAVSTYPMYRSAVFQHAGPWLAGFLRFYVICFWSLLWSLVGLPLLVEVGHVHVLIAQAIIVLAVPLLNYQIMKFWTFRHRHPR